MIPAHEYQSTCETSSLETASPFVVLLAEDEPAPRRLLTRRLEQWGFTVIAVADGAAALRAWEARAGDVDIIVTDIAMPWINGIDLASRIRDREPVTRIIFVSGAADEQDVPTEGVHATFLPKPLALEDLRRALYPYCD